mmetsp:Transcript_46152/g.69595  ORF Transcript_46152/g.69595 Transcript_46152/m.69595 type:complete len:693 (+) Transcript_46152:232-2310(+)
MKLRSIPGIGYRMEQKLSQHGLVFVSHVLDLGRVEAERLLCLILGPGNGKKILQFCLGVDHRPVQKAVRKTIGAECNYGVRFDGPYGLDYMMLGLAKEVEKRMEYVGVTGKRITLKVMQRKEGASEPAKFLGHGSCHHLSKSRDIPTSTAPTRHSNIISDIGMKLFADLGISKDEVRGMGITMSKLSTEAENAVPGANKMSDWLKQASADSCTVSNSESLVHDGTESNVCDSKTHAGHTKRHKECAPSFREDLVEEDGSTLQRQRSVRFSLDIEQCSSARYSPFSGSGTTNAAASEHSCGEDQQESLLDQDGISDVFIPSASQIDKDVLCYLPEPLQREISQKLALTLQSSEPTCQHQLRQSEVNRTPQPFIEGVQDWSVTNTPCPGQRQTQTSGVSYENSILLPSPSQIDQEQVMALPKSLREEVLRMMGEKAGCAPLEHLADDSLRVHPKKARRVAPRKKRKVGVSRRRLKTCEGNDSDGFKQVSMKRMLKLATIKSGKEILKDDLEGNFILPRELDCLPLEMQLQVVNDEMRRVTKEPNVPPKDRSGPRYLLSANQDVAIQKNSYQKCSATVHLDGASLEEKCKANHSPDMCCIEPAVNDFYKDNVVPLFEWIRSHPDPTLDDISKVQNFFSVCISEKRLDDVVKLLRSMKNMEDGWIKDTYARIIGFVENEFVRQEGLDLDSHWLGLR